MLGVARKAFRSIRDPTPDVRSAYTIRFDAHPIAGRIVYENSRRTRISAEPPAINGSTRYVMIH